MGLVPEEPEVLTVFVSIQQMFDGSNTIEQSHRTCLILCVVAVMLIPCNEFTPVCNQMGRGQVGPLKS